MAFSLAMEFFCVDTLLHRLHALFVESTPPARVHLLDIKIT
jgi:hypothetical protein